MRIFGPDFEAGWPILIIGCIAQLVNCGVGSVGYLLLMSGQQRRLIRIQMVMACVMIALSLFLIPSWGLVGAATAAALTNAMSNIWYPQRSEAKARFVSLQSQLSATAAAVAREL